MYRKKWKNADLVRMIESASYMYRGALGLLQGSLKEVEALQEVKGELESKTSLLYTRLMEDLTSQVREYE